MFCQRCGQQLRDDSNYCPSCGFKVGGPFAPIEPVRWDDHTRRGPLPPQSFSNAKTVRYENYGLISMICGLLGTVFFWLVAPGFILGIIAVIFGIMAQVRLQNKKGKAIAGLVLGIVALVLAVWMIAAALSDSGWYLNDPQMELNYI